MRRRGLASGALGTVIGRGAVLGLGALVAVVAAIWVQAEGVTAMRELESHEIRLLTLERVERDGAPVLALRGLVQHSAQTVKRLEQVREGDAVRIRVWSGLGARGESGGFTQEVALDGLAAVRLGADAAVIWSAAPP